MEISGIDVITDTGETEEHQGAVGHNIDEGTLVVLYKVNEMVNGTFTAVAYPAVIYAPGTWRRVLVQGAKGGVVESQSRRPDPRKLN